MDKKCSSIICSPSTTCRGVIAQLSNQFNSIRFNLHSTKSQQQSLQGALTTHFQQCLAKHRLIYEDFLTSVSSFLFLRVCLFSTPWRMWSVQGELKKNFRPAKNPLRAELQRLKFFASYSPTSLFFVSALLFSDTVWNLRSNRHKRCYSARCQVSL